MILLSFAILNCPIYNAVMTRHTGVVLLFHEMIMIYFFSAYKAHINATTKITTYFKPWRRIAAVVCSTKSPTLGLEAPTIGTTLQAQQCAIQNFRPIRWKSHHNLASNQKWSNKQRLSFRGQKGTRPSVQKRSMTPVGIDHCERRLWRGFLSRG